MFDLQCSQGRTGDVQDSGQGAARGEPCPATGLGDNRTYLCCCAYPNEPPNQNATHPQQAKAEQEEEYISNTLLKKIQALKQEKETLAHHYEREEECLTNDLSRKLDQLRQEKCKLEQTLEQEQECLVNKLMRKIEKLEAETIAKQTNLEQLRREMVELENTLEQEQEALVNKLWKRMDKLEAEKRSLQQQLEQPAQVAAPVTPSAMPPSAMLVETPPTPAAPQPHSLTKAAVAAAAAAAAKQADPATPTPADQAAHLSAHIQTLRSQVCVFETVFEMAIWNE